MTSIRQAADLDAALAPDHAQPTRALDEPAPEGERVSAKIDTGGLLLRLDEQDEEDEGDGIIEARDQPFGAVYDALTACGCRAAAAVRRHYLGDDFGLLAGVPEEDRSGGRGNIGLLLSVSLLPVCLGARHMRCAAGC